MITITIKSFLSSSLLILQKKLATHSSILAWRIRGQKNLEGYTPHGASKSWTQLSMNTHTHIVNRKSLLARCLLLLENKDLVTS